MRLSEQKWSGGHCSLNRDLGVLLYLVNDLTPKIEDDATKRYVPYVLPSTRNWSDVYYCLHLYTFLVPLFTS